MRIGLIRSSSIGDVVLATACMQVLEKLKAKVQVTWIGRQPALDLISKSYPDVRCIEFPRRYPFGTLLEEISDLHFLVDLQTNLRSRILCRAYTKKTGRACYRAAKAPFWRTSLVAEARTFGRQRTLPVRALQPAKAQHQMMASALELALQRELPREYLEDLVPGSSRPKLFVASDGPSQEVYWSKELKFGTWIAVAPGASFPTKRAPIALFAEIMDTLRRLYEEASEAQNGTLGLVLVGDNRDREFCSELIQRLGWNDSYLNLAGKISLWETSLVLRDVRCLLSNDSGLSHIAEALGTPVGVLFGPTVEGFGFGPHLEQSQAFSSRIGCRPCSKHGKTPCRYGDKLCFAELDPASVAKKLLESLAPPRQMGEEVP